MLNRRSLEGSNPDTSVGAAEDMPGAGAGAKTGSRPGPAVPIRPRVVLDTNVVRYFIDGTVSADDFRSLQEAEIGIHLSDTASSELICQLQKKNCIPWRDWDQARQLLVQLVDEREPILLGGWWGLARIGVLPPRSKNAVVEIKELLDRYSAGWALLTRARNPTELKHGMRIGRWQYSVSKVVEAMKGEDAEWVRGFTDAGEFAETFDPGFREALGANAEFAARLKEAVHGTATRLAAVCSAMEPSAECRLEPVTRVNHLLSLRYLKRKRPYDPAKNDNDAFDLELLKYLAFPTAVITTDGGISAKLKDAGVPEWQRALVIAPADLKSGSTIDNILATRAWTNPTPLVPF